ncbi:hypothetical protein [Stenotrophomonas sp.]|uniref:hypothetical protein n=1 Tax=Stenotrophomonas sp. TaxID=69392 RepID=UPI0028B01830|nr:hypothetical protein [Stenotrophomonas sp.]
MRGCSARQAAVPTKVGTHQALVPTKVGIHLAQAPTKVGIYQSKRRPRSAPTGLSG